MKKIQSKDFRVNKYIRACEQRSAALKAKGKEKGETEFKSGLHKLTV